MSQGELRHMAKRLVAAEFIPPYAYCLVRRPNMPNRKGMYIDIAFGG
jgi:hypothetical protein